MTEPMTAERLAEIRAWDAINILALTNGDVMFHELLEEVDRLRAELAAATRTVLLIDDGQGLTDEELPDHIAGLADAWHRSHGWTPGPHGGGECEHCTTVVGGPCTCGSLAPTAPACPIHLDRAAGDS